MIEVSPSKRGERSKAKQFMPFLSAQVRLARHTWWPVTTDLPTLPSSLLYYLMTVQEAIRKAQSAEATAPRAEAGTTLDRRLQPYVVEVATLCAMY